MADSTVITVNVNDDSIDKSKELEEAKKRDKWTGKSIFTMVTAVAVAVAVIAGIIFTVITVPRKTPGINFPVSNSVLGRYRFAAVAADAAPCATAATLVLAEGGSAVDGAITATLCTGVFNMHNAGIGGGFFMTIWDAASQTGYVVNAREMAPLNATENMFEGNVSSVLGPFAIAVPGEIAGYWAAHQKFGRVPWKRLFQPSIDFCRNGFTVSSVLGEAIEETVTDIAAEKNQVPFKTLFEFLINPETKKPYQTGETIKCTLLADTYAKIAELGGDDYYNGSLAKDILADLQEIGSPINETDLQSYEAKWEAPIRTLIQNRVELISTPPPGSGAILSFILNILAGYNFTQSSSQDTLTYHRFVESLKFGYAKRTYLGDVPGLDGLIANLTSPSYGEHIRLMINDSSTQPTSYYDPDVKSMARTHGTSHISVLDALGNAAAITSTINLYFGSGVMGRRTGIIFNNEMDDFSSPNETNAFNLPPSPNNFIKPGKRPQSSTCPAVFLIPDPKNPQGNTSIATLITGAAGGSRITSGVAYLSMRVLWFQETVKQAIDALRLHHQLYPEKLYYESGMPTMLLDALRLKGHVNQTRRDGIISVAQAIQRWNDGSILANSDFRKDIAGQDGF